MGIETCFYVAYSWINSHQSCSVAEKVQEFSTMAKAEVVTDLVQLCRDSPAPFVVVEGVLVVCVSKCSKSSATRRKTEHYKIKHLIIEVAQLCVGRMDWVK